VRELAERTTGTSRDVPNRYGSWIGTLLCVRVAAVMVDTQRSRPRVLARLVAVSSTVLALGAAAHVAGAGAPPAGRAVVVLAAATLVGALLVARRRLQVRTLLPGVAVWQWLLHQAFTATAALPAAPHAAGHPARGTVTSLSAAAGAVPHTSATVVAAHVVATVATVGLLVATERGAERALERLAWALPVLAGALTLPVVGTARRVPAAGRVRRAVTPSRTPGAHGSRAPPGPGRGPRPARTA